VQHQRDYASIEVDENATETAVTTIDTWYQVLVFDTNGAYRGAIPDHTNDHITIVRAGNYEGAVAASVIGGNNAVIEMAFFKNNGATQLGPRAYQPVTETGDGGCVSVKFNATLAASDTIELWVRNTANTTNITVQGGLMRIDEET